MIDKKPYLLRAIYDWLVDNNFTPQIIIANPSGGWVSGVPAQYTEQEQLVLNISPTATKNLTIEKDYIYFDTRFSGTVYSVIVDIVAVAGIFARENNAEGEFFDLSDEVFKGKKEKVKSEKKSKSQGGFKFVK